MSNTFTLICTVHNTGLLPVFASVPKFVFSDSLPAPAAVKILNLCLYIPLTSCSLSDPFFSSHLKSKSHPLAFNGVSFTSFSTTSSSQIKPQPFVENGSEIPFQCLRGSESYFSSLQAGIQERESQGYCDILSPRILWDLFKIVMNSHTGVGCHSFSRGSS